MSYSFRIISAQINTEKKSSFWKFSTNKPYLQIEIKVKIILA